MMLLIVTSGSVIKAAAGTDTREYRCLLAAKMRVRVILVAATARSAAEVHRVH